MNIVPLLVAAVTIIIVIRLANKMLGTLPKVGKGKKQIGGGDFVNKITMKAVTAPVRSGYRYMKRRLS